MAGIEPATDGLRNRCSTAELHWHQSAEKPPKHNQAYRLWICFSTEGISRQANGRICMQMKDLFKRRESKRHYFCEKEAVHSGFGNLS